MATAPTASPARPRAGSAAPTSARLARRPAILARPARAGAPAARFFPTLARAAVILAGAVVLLLAGITPPGAVLGAGAPPDPRLTARLDSATALTVWALAESARAVGLPPEPILGKALEGAARRAAPARIVAAARRQAAALAGAREALGDSSTETEMVAGATVLLAGVPADTLARLRAARPSRSLVIPLVVLGDLVARHVPEETASAVVVAITAAGFKDVELSQLRQRVERDIAAGADPATAARVRMEGLLMLQRGSRILPGSRPDRGARPPPRGPGP